MKSQLNTDISRSAFWERLGRERLNDYLGQVVAELMVTFTSSILRGHRILTALGVVAIWLVDASSITLWKRAKNHFPGTRTTAGIKWHASFDLLTGRLTWFQVTPAKTQERNGFPALELLKGK
jgi:hypothetical protein